MGQVIGVEFERRVQLSRTIKRKTTCLAENKHNTAKFERNDRKENSTLDDGFKW
jgi:hypothetical protein